MAAATPKSRHEEKISIGSKLKSKWIEWLYLFLSIELIFLATTPKSKSHTATPRGRLPLRGAIRILLAASRLRRDYINCAVNPLVPRGRFVPLRGLKREWNLFMLKYLLSEIHSLYQLYRKWHIVRKVRLLLLFRCDTDPSVLWRTVVFLVLKNHPSTGCSKRRVITPWLDAR